MQLSEFLEHLRGRIAISDVVRLYLPLKRQGRQWVGLCPFHKEKTPSFHVNDAKGRYHCFGCSSGGDALEFLKKIRNIPFLEALSLLAEQAGLTVPAFRKSQVQETQDSTNMLVPLLEVATLWFQEQLKRNYGEAARSYLQERGVLAQSIETFRLGYAPSGQRLREHLLRQGFSEAMQKEAGLLIDSETRSGYERFRQRLIFPIFNRQNAVIGFGGRVLGAGEPKYLNSPETPLFHKSKVLYGISQLETSKELVVVEGYLDVIALHQIGFKNAVAPLGTALSEEQIILLWRYCSEPLLCFDGDQAGLAAAQKALTRALPLLKVGYTLKVVFLPPGEDPDSLVRQGAIAQLKDKIARPVPLIEALWQNLTSSVSLTNPDGVALLHHKIKECLQAIKDPEVQKYYRRDLEQRLWNLGKKSAKKGYEVLPIISSQAWGEKILLVTLLNHPTLIDEVYEQLMTISFSDCVCERMRKDLLRWPLEDEGLQTEQEKIDKEDYPTIFGEINRLYSFAPFANAKVSVEHAKQGWLHVWQQLFERKNLEAQLIEVIETPELDDQSWARLKQLKQALNLSCN